LNNCRCLYHATEKVISRCLVPLLGDMGVSRSLIEIVNELKESIRNKDITI